VDLTLTGASARPQRAAGSVSVKAEP